VPYDSILPPLVVLKCS